MTDHETTNESAIVAAETVAVSEFTLDLKNPGSILQYALDNNLLNETQRLMYNAVHAMPIEVIAPALATKELIETVKTHHKNASSIDHLDVFMNMSNVKEILRTIGDAVRGLNDLLYSYNDTNQGANLTAASFTAPGSKSRSRAKKDRPTYDELAKMILSVDKEAMLSWMHKEHFYVNSTIKAEDDIENNNGVKTKVTRYKVYWKNADNTGSWIEIGALPSKCRNAVTPKDAEKGKRYDINVWEHVDVVFNDGIKEDNQRMSLDAFLNRANQ